MLQTIQHHPHPAPPHSEDSGGCFVMLGLFAIFLVLGLGLSFWGWRIVQDARASTLWPQAQGVVVYSEVSRHSDSDGSDSYSPEVTYTYLAGNRSHESYTIKFGENSYGNRGQAEEIVARYPVGRKVTVFYDPARPDKSVLEPGVTAGSYIVLGIGVLFVLISFVIPPAALYLRKVSQA